MGQIIKFTNNNGKNIEFSMTKPFILQSIEGLSGIDATEITYKGSNQDGSEYQGSNFENREVTIKFSIEGETPKELLELRSNINNVFNPKLGEGTLLYSYQGVERILNCVADGTPFLSLKGNKSYCEGEIILIAHNPYFKDIKENKSNIAMWRGMFHFPLVIPQNIGIIMGLREPSLIVNVFNCGDVKCGLRIEFRAKGTVKNPSLFNVNTREYIKINKTMAAGEIINVNTSYSHKKIESELNGVKTNIMNYLAIPFYFLQLDPGDNLFRYDAEENLNNLEVNIYFIPQYLGV